MRQREFNMNPPIDAMDDAQYVRRPARGLFFSRLMRWHLREWFIVIGVSLAVGMVLVNALFLQSGPHPAPIFANRAPAASNPPIALPRPRPPATKAALAPLPAHDAIADLLSQSKRVIAIQRALAAYGFGQIRPTGTFDPATKSAIEEFERHRKLPVTGQISERNLRELALMTGRPLE